MLQGSQHLLCSPSPASCTVQVRFLEHTPHIQAHLYASGPIDTITGKSKEYKADDVVPLGENARLHLYGHTKDLNTNVGAALHAKLPFEGADLNTRLHVDYSGKQGMNTGAALGVAVPISEKLTVNGNAGMDMSNCFGPHQHVDGGVVYKPHRDVDFTFGARRDFIPGHAPIDNVMGGVVWRFP